MIYYNAGCFFYCRTTSTCSPTFIFQSILLIVVQSRKLGKKLRQEYRLKSFHNKRNTLYIYILLLYVNDIFTVIAVAYGDKKCGISLIYKEKASVVWHISYENRFSTACPSMMHWFESTHESDTGTFI